VRQGDTLSPLLFCIAKDVLSKGIVKLVQDGKVGLISGTEYQSIQSHTLYADNVMFLCKGKISCIEELKKLFTDYANCSSQLMNPSKSLIFSSSILEPRFQAIVNMLGFYSGSLSLTYVGVPIFKAKAKKYLPFCGL